MRRLGMIAGLILGATAADATDLRELCPDRPGRLTPACIVDAGHLLVETGAADYSRDRTADATTTMLTLADTLVRAGVTDRLEAFVEWSPYNRLRTTPRDGMATTVHGVGDVTFGIKRSLLNPDGKGVSVAVQPFLTAPTAKRAIGAGGWTQGLIVPVTIELPDDFQLGVSPEIDRLPNADRGGHHPQYIGVVGLSRKIGAVTPSIELYASRDDDPGDRSTEATIDVAAAWVPTSAPDLQFDTGTYVGLNHDTPNIEVFVGVSRRF